MHPAVMEDVRVGEAHTRLSCAVDQETLRVSDAACARAATNDPHLMPVGCAHRSHKGIAAIEVQIPEQKPFDTLILRVRDACPANGVEIILVNYFRSEEHTSELQSRLHL